MHEEEKLDEARHFLSKMAVSIDNPTVFRFELSAFLSAARSVLQYALEEVKTKAGGQAWYDAQVSTNPEIRFFKGKRDTSIHVEPVVPTTNLGIAITDVVRLSDSFSIKLVDKDGNVVRESTAASPPPPQPAIPAPPASISYSYTFPDWTGTEDVLALSSKYLAALDVLVKDGFGRGFLTKTP
jgi:hypothetical protein